MEYELIRNVTKNECSWLDRTFKKGEKVYKYSGTTYGCCSWNGSPFSIEKGQTPFFELPNDSVKKIS